jgi:hypothetical protein
MGGMCCTNVGKGAKQPIVLELTFVISRIKNVYVSVKGEYLWRTRGV